MTENKNRKAGFDFGVWIALGAAFGVASMGLLIGVVVGVLVGVIKTRK